MYNLLISLSAAAITFGLGSLAGRWYYGFAPAMLVGPLVYFLIARHIGKQVELVMAAAMQHLQSAQMSASRPAAMKQIDKAKEIIKQGYPFGKWQFLVSQQINAQLGALEYMQQNHKAARELLENTWSRNWQAAGMLAALDLREGKKDQAVERLPKMATFAKKEALMWGLSAYVLLKAGKRDEALRKVVEGLEATDGAEALKTLRGAIANDQIKRFSWSEVFGQGWFQFFPEQAQGAQQAANRASRRNAPAFGRGGKTWPAPRR